MILEDATIHRLIIETVKGPIERGEGISPQDWIKFARTIEEMTIAALQRTRTLTVTNAQPSPAGQGDALDEVACDLPSLFGRASLEGHEAGQRLAKEVQAKMRAALAARQPVDFNDEELQFYREHIGNDLDNALMLAGVFEVNHEGGYEACWANSMEALKRLIARQPVGLTELGWALKRATPEQVLQYLEDDPNMRACLSIHLSDTVDPGELHDLARSWIVEAGGTVADTKHACAEELLALIDSKAVGNG